MKLQITSNQTYAWSLEYFIQKCSYMWSRLTATTTMPYYYDLF